MPAIFAAFSKSIACAIFFSETPFKDLSANFAAVDGPPKNPAVSIAGIVTALATPGLPLVDSTVSYKAPPPRPKPAPNFLAAAVLPVTPGAANSIPVLRYLPPVVCGSYSATPSNAGTTVSAMPLICADVGNT